MSSTQPKKKNKNPEIREAMIDRRRRRRRRRRGKGRRGRKRGRRIPQGYRNNYQTQTLNNCA